MRFARRFEVLPPKGWGEVLAGVSGGAVAPEIAAYRLSYSASIARHAGRHAAASAAEALADTYRKVAISPNPRWVREVALEDVWDACTSRVPVPYSRIARLLRRTR